MPVSIQQLRNIIQSAAEKQTQQEKAQHLVNAICEVLHVPVSSLYVVTGEYLLMVATQGLSESGIGSATLPIGTGLVGTIAKTGNTLNLANGPSHPAFHRVDALHEDGFVGFLGAPIIHLGQTVGVLVVQTNERRAFTDDEESFVITIASQLAVDFEVSDFVQTQTLHNFILKGKAASPGIGIGQVVSVSVAEYYDDIDTSPVYEPQNERHVFEQALTRAKHDVDESFGRLGGDLSFDSLADAYVAMLSDPAFLDSVHNVIDQGHCAEYSVQQAAEQVIEALQAIDDPYLKARAEDVYHVSSKIIAFCQSEHTHQNVLKDPVILVGHNVAATDIASYAQGQIVGVVSRTGSSLSHTAIVAKALGIPCVMGIDNLAAIDEGEKIVIDGHVGRVIVHPTDTLVAEYRLLIEREAREYAELEELKDLMGITLDGQRISLMVNTGLLSEISPGLQRGAEGVGLYRSEIPFLVAESFPTESEQEAIYRHVIECYQGKPVYMRTLDIGGDKPLPYFSFNEENPFLGWRGIRFALDNRPILRTQVRAMLKAGRDVHTLNIMIPMVGEIDQIDAFKALLIQCREELQNEGYKVNMPKLGIMLEVPSLISQMDFLSGRVDFISIGSNDLTQYLLAVDRNNERVASLFNHVHPAVIAEVYRIVQKAKMLGIKVGVCGEMASYPLAVILLVGMDVDSLSMSAFQLPKVKCLIRALSQERAQMILQRVLRKSSAADIHNLLLQELRDSGVDYLFKSLS
jgi:phosphoenolpyruvate-protein phosphotransferase